MARGTARVLDWHARFPGGTPESRVPMSSNLPSIRLERILNAPIERVFRAFVDPADAVRWWGPAGVRTSEVEIDLRVGGTCRWVMHPKGATAVLRGRILELDPPRLLVMTNQWDGDAAVT